MLCLLNDFLTMNVCVSCGRNAFQFLLAFFLLCIHEKMSSILIMRYIDFCGIYIVLNKIFCSCNSFRLFRFFTALVALEVPTVCEGPLFLFCECHFSLQKRWNLHFNCHFCESLHANFIYFQNFYQKTVGMKPLKKNLIFFFKFLFVKNV